MKSINLQRSIKFLLSAFLLSFLLSQCSSSKKVVKLNSDEVKNMVNSSRFVFVANRVTPLRGRTRFLTSYYDVVVKKDSLTTFLPFFGRAFQAPMDPSKGGIQFISTNFTYNVTTKNNNEWDIIIKPNDYADVQQLYFNIFDNGTANLNVVNTHRDPISFSGHIEKIKE
ncbi:MAG TPA: DUF4251 domain-containing protein [Hanamia sp.]|nr:DUF4251 domain-containing protein [Hanamia sp.]